MNRLNFGQRIFLEILWIKCRAFGMLPLFVQHHIIAPIIYFFVYKVFRYRVKVVDDNLAHALADRSPQERKEIRRKFYVILSEIFVSTIALASPKMGKKFDDPNDPESEATKLYKEVKGRNWIGLTCHFGLWEHLLFWGEFTGSYNAGAYHKLSNVVMDELFLRLRTRNHTNFIALERAQVTRFCIKNRDGFNGKNFCLGLIADQNPTMYADSRWIDFLGRETIFFEGAEKLSLKLKLPVYFIYQKRIGRGLYRFAYDLLYDGEESVEPYEITRRYVRRLEQAIRQTPEMWLWSHRRWKHKRE